ncbi:XRCC4-like factor-domain-containing protein [Coniochaeta sp. 2T2.1]|nr:XRCC4-like factor-domain-containing protein [Coniochaeta sp. 2T2.1]
MEAEMLVILSSSPDFPSIDELLPKREKKPRLRSGSRAAPIPETALKSFKTASHFWHSTIAEDKESVGDAQTPAGDKERDHAVNKRASPDPVDLPAETLPEAAIAAAPAPAIPAKKPRAPRRPKAKPVEAKPVVAEIPEGLQLSPKEKPWKKYKDKDPTDGQTKIAQGKVTKPSAAKPKQTRKKAETASKHFAPAANSAPLEIDDDPIDLEPAMKRRTDWTPTKNTDQPVIVLDPSPVKDAVSPRPSAAQSTFPTRQDIFKNLRDTYSCSDVEDTGRATTPLGEPTDVLGKRKLIEMVATTKAAEEKTPEVSPVKQKAPKKKPRTITELATAAYRVVDIVEDDQQPQEASVLNYFTTNEEPETAQAGKDKDAPSKAVKGPKPGAKPKAKPKRVSKKKAEPPQPILLSPESAMRQVSRQDFVFGTSSQLATEADAGLLRDMQRAMRESNRWDDDKPFLSSPVNSNVAAKSTGNRLWRAGARDEEGDLLEVEVIDLVDSPAIEKDLTNPDVILSLAADAAKADPKKNVDLPPRDAIFISISSSLTPTHPAPRLSLTQKQSASSVPAAAITTPLHLSLTQPIDLDEDPPASNQEQYHQMTSSMPEALAPAPPEIPLGPKYELYTDAQLAGEIQSYGFKPIKKRTAAIALLQQCWESKNKIRSQALGQGSTAFLSTSSTAAAKAMPSASAPAGPKPRGRPKKTASVAGPSESASASASAAVPAPESVKRARGRPKKDAAAAETAAPKKASKTTTTTKKRPSLSPPPAPISEPTPGPSTPKRRRKASVQTAPIEIADSDQSDLDDPLATSSAASSPAQANEFSSPVAGVDLSMTEADESVLSLTSSPTNQQTRLFKYITDAVRTAPRSMDPQNPSWHEKMLLYDPVVLEDLTAWLNAGQLDRVGCEEEVGCQDVKKWCENALTLKLYEAPATGEILSLDSSHVITYLRHHQRQASSSWRPLPGVEVSGIPGLLVSTDFTAQSYAVRLTDLANVWTESLDKKPIIMRGLKEDTSIDPTDGPDQIRKLLDLIWAAFDPGAPEHGDTTLALSKATDTDKKGGDLEIHVTVVLPKPLRPLKWPIYLKKLPQSAVATELVLPLIHSHHARAREVDDLIGSLKEKDGVITKLVDKLEAVGTGLEHVFTALSGRRKVTRALAEERIRGLAPFKEDEFRKHAEAADRDADGADDVVALLGNVFGKGGGLPPGSALDIGDSPALNDWWTKLGKGKTSALVSRGKDKGSASSSKANSQSAPTRPAPVPMDDDGDETESGDDEDDFQVQSTPPKATHTKPSKKPKEDIEDDDEDFEVQATPPSRKRDRHPRATRVLEDDDDETEGEEAEIPDSMPTKPSPPKEPSKPTGKRLGAIGGRNKKPPPEEETPPPPPTPSPPHTHAHPAQADDASATASDSSPSPPPPPKSSQPRRGGGIGRIGGRKPAPPAKATTPEPSQPPAGSQQTPRRRLGLIGKQAPGSADRGRGRTKTPVQDDDDDAEGKEKEEEKRETSQERADRKRAELKRELEAKHQQPVRKKRKF